MKKFLLFTLCIFTTLISNAADIAIWQNGEKLVMSNIDSITFENSNVKDSVEIEIPDSINVFDLISGIYEGTSKINALGTTTSSTNSTIVSEKDSSLFTIEIQSLNVVSFEVTDFKIDDVIAAETKVKGEISLSRKNFEVTVKLAGDETNFTKGNINCTINIDGTISYTLTFSYMNFPIAIEFNGSKVN